MKTTVSALLALLLCFLLTVPASAATIVDSGECGENVTWTLDSEGTLTISGTGEMKDYDYYGVPWSSRRKDIRRVVIQSGVTSIGRYAFEYCSSLTDVYYGGTEAQWSAIKIDSYNDPLKSATIQYNSSGDTKSLNSAVITVPRASYPYSGKAIKPAVTVRLNGEKLTKNTDYTVKYSGNKEVGTATVTGTGKYTGTIQTTFLIVK